MNDTLVYCKKVRILIIMDDYYREVLAVEIDLSMPSQNVIRILEEIITRRSKPA